MASQAIWLKSARPPLQTEVILRALCRPHGSASWAEALTGISAEAPPGLGFYSVPESPRPVGQNSECGRWTARGGGRRNNLREKDGISHLQLCPHLFVGRLGNAVVEAWKGRRCSHLKQDLSGEGIGGEFRDLSFRSSSVTLGSCCLLWA